MKRTLCLAMFLALGVTTAQQSTFSVFLDAFNTSLRVAATPCPAIFTAVFTEPTCYVHGYDDFFDFKERYTAVTGDLTLSRRSSYWRTVSLDLGGAATQAFSSSHRLRNGPQLTVTYAADLVVLEFAP